MKDIEPTIDPYLITYSIFQKKAI